MLEHISGQQSLPNVLHGVIGRTGVGGGDSSHLMVGEKFETEPFFVSGPAEQDGDFIFRMREGLKRHLEAKETHNILGTKPQVK